MTIAQQLADTVFESGGYGYIYALSDSRAPEEARYIGLTRHRIGRRLRQHCATAWRQEDTDRSRWIRGVESAGASVEIRPLALVPSFALEHVEIDTIRIFRGIGGSALTNMSDGGEGYRHTDVERLRQSERMKARFSDPVEREKLSQRLRERFADPGVRAEHSRTIKISWSDPGRRRKQSERSKAALANPAARQRMRDRVAERYATDPELRQRIGKCARERMATPEARAEHGRRIRAGIAAMDDAARTSHREAVRSYNNNPEVREVKRLRMKTRMADQEVIRRISEGTKKALASPERRQRISAGVTAAWARRREVRSKEGVTE